MGILGRRYKVCLVVKEERKGRGRKKKKSEAKALPNRNWGLFPTLLFLLVFSLLCFQRLQCLQSFTFSKTTMSSIFYIFKDFNVFSLLRFQRLQCLLLYVLQDYNVFCSILSRLQCPLLLCSTGLQCPPFYIL